MRQIGAALTNFRDNAPPGPDPSAFDFEGSTPVGDVTIPGADSTLGAVHYNSLTLGGAGKIEVPPDWTVALLGNQAVIVNATGSTILSTGSIGGSFSGDNVTVVASTGDNDVSVTGSLRVALGPGNDTIFASGLGTVDAGFGNNLIKVGKDASGIFVMSEAQDTVIASGTATVSSSGDNARILGNTLGASLFVQSSGKNVTVEASGAPTAVTTLGSNALIFGTFNSTPGALSADIGVSSNNSTVIGGHSAASVTLDGANGLLLGGFDSAAGPLTASVGGTNNTISAGNSNVAASTGGSNAMILGGFTSSAGALDLSLAGIGDTVNVGFGNANVTITGKAGDPDLVSNAVVYGSFGSIHGSLNTLVNFASGDTIISGNSDASITAGGGTKNLLIVGGDGALNFLGVAGGTTSTIFGSTGPENISVGGGSLTFVAGGNATITSGVNVAPGDASAVTLFGGGVASDVTFLGSLGGAYYIAGGGNETLNAAGSSVSNTLWGGTGSASLVGGSAADTLIAGSGSATLGGGAGDNIFTFLNDLTGGAQDFITDFTTSDTLALFGYGSNPYTATVSGGDTTLTLSDNTKITFVGIDNINQVTSHIFTSG